ncbi:hypothetical protein PHMEG_000926 [Phytophthora megakarya]|uniref:Uncharacterized protein n=1 Tax=Phytophthora megakarya TaxID=4795 RepID=A0A225X4C3_9STRA|nr:hypothetical protein PHMEG_000926 [Phytophthora megakarya]
MASASKTAVTSGSFSTVDTSIATFSPGMVPSRGLMGTPVQATENQYAGAGWSNSNCIKEDTSRQSSNNGFAESDTTMMDDLAPPVEETSPTNSGYSSSQYAPIRPESNDSVVMESMQSETQSDQAVVYDSTSSTVKESSSLAASEFRLPTISEVRPSPRAGSSPSDSRDKLMQSSEDDLNAFADFPELAFDDDSSNFVKENNPSNISRKRGIEEV